MIQDPCQPFHSEVLEKLWHQITQGYPAREPRKRPLWVPTFGWVFRQPQAMQASLVSGPCWLWASLGCWKGKDLPFTPSGITPGPLVSGAGEGP